MINISSKKVLYLADLIIFVVNIQEMTYTGHSIIEYLTRYSWNNTGNYLMDLKASILSLSVPAVVFFNL